MRTLRFLQHQYGFADDCRGKEWQLVGWDERGGEGSAHGPGRCNESAEERRVHIPVVGCRLVQRGHAYHRNTHSVAVEVGSYCLDRKSTDHCRDIPLMVQVEALVGLHSLLSLPHYYNHGTHFQGPEEEEADTASLFRRNSALLPREGGVCPDLASLASLIPLTADSPARSTRGSMRCSRFQTDEGV